MTTPPSDERKKDQPRGHVFDGIFEYDNDLPDWWVALFVVTIVFGVGYMAWFHLGLFPSSTLIASYEQDAKAAAADVLGANPDATDFLALARDTEQVQLGKEAYISTCAPCHGNDGQGVVGPNLTDDFWIHGASFAAVETVVNKGVVERGMPAWGEILGATKVRQIVAFISTLQGSSPADPKAPQGEPGRLQ